jgi:PAS domain S-box-containing protein
MPPAEGDGLRDLVVRLAERAEDVIYRFRLKPEPGWDYLSPSIERLTGYSADELYADWDLAVGTIHPDDRDELTGGEGGRYLGGRGVYRWIRKDGAVVWVERANVVIVDDAGDPVAVEGVARNITERMRAGDELSSRDRTVRALFEEAGVPMLVLDDRRIFVDGNPAACRLLGVSRESLVSRLADDFTPPEDRAKVEELWDAFVARGSLRAEARLLRSDGTTREVEFTATASISPGHHLIAVYDLTERRQLEGQLRHAQKLEAVGRLAGGVAHDFNNQLSAIRLYCDLIQAHADDPERVRTEIEGITRVAELASQLTSQLLAFGRRQLLQPRVLDLNVVVQQAEQMLRRLLGSDITLVTELSPGLEPIKADLAQLEQVIVNLALNGRDAMPDGGTLTIRTANEAREDGRYVLLAVSDSGVGMDEPTRSQIFEPFFTTKELGEGTGLGLATVYGVVSQSGGTIEVTSAPGGGSTFSILLPRSESGAEARRQGEGPDAVGGSETVLLVEDEDAVRNVTAEVLGRAGYSVVAASDGPEALELASGHDGRIAVVVTDVLMPNLGGVELVERLREREPGLAAVFMSGYAEASAVSPDGSAAPTAFVQKPFSSDELGRAIRAVLDATKR